MVPQLLEQLQIPEVDRARITITVPSLQEVTDKGDIIEIALIYRFKFSTTAVVLTLVFKTQSPAKSSRYQRDYIVPDRELSLTYEWCAYADETSSKKASSTFLLVTTEIQTEKLAYPNSALVGLRFSSKQFQNILKRKYLVRGTKVRIPQRHC